MILFPHDETQVAEGGWVDGERGERTPFEASLLSSLDHPGRILITTGRIICMYSLASGIVKVLDVFQNPSYVQVWMQLCLPFLVLL